MKIIASLIVYAAACLALTAKAEEAQLEISWSKNRETETYRNNQTNIAFPKSIAGFEQKRATPANKDGSASFAYVGKHGVVTVYLTHRLIMGQPGKDDCTSRFCETFLKGMDKAHGEADMKQHFSFTFVFEGKAVTGLGATVHYVSSPLLKAPVHSEFGAVLVGDFLYYYRASFPDKEGLLDLAPFLQEIGFKDKTNREHSPDGTTPATNQGSRQP